MHENAGQDAVFVVGLQRSGTTWVANMLVGSGQVAAVTAQEHRGVHESIYFSHFATAFGLLSDPAAQERFHAAFEHSDYYLLTGLDRDFLDAAIRDASDHADVFEVVMRQVMRDQKCTHWLEKSPHHTLLTDALAARFPKAQFVCVVRDSKSLLTSRLAAYGRTPATGLQRAKDLLRGAISNALYTRVLRAFALNNPQALLLNYDEIVVAPQDGQAQLVSFLGLKVAPGELESGFAANTSHSGSDKTRNLSAIDLLIIRLGDWIGQALPVSILRRIEAKRRAKRGTDWPDWVWMRSGWEP